MMILLHDKPSFVCKVALCILLICAGEELVEKKQIPAVGNNLSPSSGRKKNCERNKGCTHFYSGILCVKEVKREREKKRIN